MGIRPRPREKLLRLIRTKDALQRQIRTKDASNVFETRTKDVHDRELKKGKKSIPQFLLGQRWILEKF